MMIFTILTLISVFKSRRKNQNSSSTKSKDVKFAITSLSLNLMFFILAFPIGLLQILDEKNQFGTYMHDYLQHLLVPLFYINYANLFYTSIIINRMFREEFFTFLKEIKDKLCLFFLRINR